MDESAIEELRGPDRIVDPKTTGSQAYVRLPTRLQADLDEWMEQMSDQRPEAFCSRRSAARR